MPHATPSLIDDQNIIKNQINGQCTLDLHGHAATLVKVILTS